MAESQAPDSISPEPSLPGFSRSSSSAVDLTQSHSSSNIDAESDRSRLRIKVEDVMDKLKDKARSSTDVDDTRRDSQESPRRLSKLIPRRVKSKRKKRNSLLGEAGGDAHSGGDTPLTPCSTIHTTSSLSVTPQPFSANSQESLNSPHDMSGGSSLLTEDSDAEVSPIHRPGQTFPSSPSHAPYLTLSSPLIAAETVAVPETAPIVGSLPTTPARPADRSPTRPLFETPSTPHSRSTTPLNKLRQPRAPSPKITAADGDLLKTGGGVGVIATLFGGNKKPLGKEPANSVESSPALGSDRSGNWTKATLVAEPELIGSPSTVVTPPTPTRQSPRTSIGEFSSDTAPTSLLSHRRAKSSISSLGKFQNPLTPAVEEVRTPGGSLASPGGFFSSVVSATQSAVNSISTTFGSSPGLGHQKSKSTSTIVSAEGRPGSSARSVATDNIDDSAHKVEPKVEPKPAVATLGSGDLSLGLLGISESSADASPMNSNLDLSEEHGRSRSATQTTQNSQPTAFPAYDESSAAAHSALDAVTEPALNERAARGPGEKSISASRATSLAVLSSVPGDQTPPRVASTEPDPNSIRRTGSVRSRISRSKWRVRGSSKDSGLTIANAIVATHSTATGSAVPSLTAHTRRPTGYAVASSKRNRDFHALFRSVPEDDYLIEDYSAALQRDILLHGRLYVSEQHICFSSNILGWVTNLVISFNEVVAMEKKTTAVIFPNAIVIQTLQARNVFASFISRDSTYDLLIGIWKIGHPNLKVSQTGHSLGDEAVAEQAEKGSEDSEGTDEESDDVSDFADGDEDDDGDRSYIDGRDGSVDGSDVAESTKGPSTRVTSLNGSPQKSAEGAAHGTSTSTEFPGPATHASTECSDQDTHYDKQLVDTTIPAPLGKVYSMMFGPTSGVVMRKFLLEDQKSGDLQMEDDKKGLGDENKSFSYSFIKPLYAAIGPKQTKCIVNQTLDAFDLSKAVSVTCSTQTPDVPSGNAFVVKTKYCLMWGPQNSTRLLMNCTIEWSSKSWLKGPIEKGANEGQLQYGKDIVAFFKTAVAARAPRISSASKSKKKRSKRAHSSPDKSTQSQSKGTDGTQQAQVGGTWGLIGQIQSMLGPWLSMSSILAILLSIVTLLWLRAPTARHNSNVGGLPASFSASERSNVFEGLWKHEESELWEWMEQRLDLGNIVGFEGSESDSTKYSTGSPQAASSNDKERMDAREIDYAIEITERRLEAFKASLERQRRRDGDVTKH